jgi:hypothetical protein
MSVAIHSSSPNTNTSNWSERFKKLSSFTLGTLAGLTLAVWILVLVSQFAKAATFNNYFNNVEQGPNSVSNPTLTVSGGAVENKKSATALQPDTQESTAPIPTQPVVAEQIGPGNQSNQAITAINATQPEVSPWRLGLFVETLGTKDQDKNQRSKGGLLSLSYTLNSSFSVSALGAALTEKKSYYGAEAEITPIHLSLFDARDLLDLGLLVGGTSLGKGTPHIGLKAAINFGPRYALVAQFRSTITSKDEKRFGSGDLGFTMRF